MARSGAADRRKKSKAAIITISSSSSSSSEDMDDDDDEEEEEEEGREEEEDDEDDEENSEVSSSGDDDDEDSEYEHEDEQDVDDSEEEEIVEEGGTQTAINRKKRKMTKSSSGGGEGEEDLCDRVVGLLQRAQDLNILKLEECKAYLRKHGLRLSGPKAVCILRIQEHWRLKEGNSEKYYPRSSFSINCRGDVCTGDTILFKQRVYEKFDIVTRGGRIIGTRTIAGRVVKESYGSGKQQHTFTVEILWSKGVKTLPTLFPLLVKGRNLYKLRTFRQCWDNEAERLKILAEKHKRGAAARHVRAIAKAKSAERGSKRRRHSCDIRAPPLKQRKKAFKPETRSQEQMNHHNKTTSSCHERMKRTVNPRALQSTVGLSGQALTHVNGFQAQYTIPRSFPGNIGYHTNTGFYERNSSSAFDVNRGMPLEVNSRMPHVPSYQFGSSSTMPFDVNRGMPLEVNRRMPYVPSYQLGSSSTMPLDVNRRMHHVPSHQSGSSSTVTAALYPQVFNRSNCFGNPPVYFGSQFVRRNSGYFGESNF